MNTVFVLVFVALFFISNNDARKSSPLKTLRKSSREVQRAAYFAVFGLQYQNAKYISLRSVDDAKKEIIDSGPTTMYFLTLTVRVIDNGEEQEEKCDIVIMDKPNGDPFNSFVSKQCDGILGQLDPPIMMQTNEPWMTLP